MFFERQIGIQLSEWSLRPNRMPLVLLGARQVGKTTILQEWSKQNYDKVAYVNFDKDLDLHSFFEVNKDPHQIIESLSLYLGQDIAGPDSIMIFDEIQECRAALTSLKYFQEEGISNVIAAGSLLGLTLGHNASFPVGKVEFLRMMPLTYREYLAATDPKLYAAYTHFLGYNVTQPIPRAFFDPMMNAYDRYLVCGGMPAAAKTLVTYDNFDSMRQVQNDILSAYMLDFAKHSTDSMVSKLRYVWQSLPSQLIKENRKFIYKVIKSGARAREYESAIVWLEQAGLVYKVYNIEKPNIPLSIYQDLGAFKLYLVDSGLLGAMAKIDPKTLWLGHDLITEFKGALAENMVCQHLYSEGFAPLYYWTSARTAEVDFVIVHNNDIIPIEVKSNVSSKAKSLALYDKRYEPKLRIRFSRMNRKMDGNLLNIPLFYAGELEAFLKVAL